MTLGTPKRCSRRLAAKKLTDPKSHSDAVVTLSDSSSSEGSAHVCSDRSDESERENERRTGNKGVVSKSPPKKPMNGSGRKVTINSNVHVTPYSPERVARRSRNRASEHSDLFEVLRSKPSRLSIMVNSCIDEYVTDEEAGGIGLLNIILEASGFPGHLIDVNDARDRPVGEVIDEVVGTIDRRCLSVGEKYPVSTREKSVKEFKRRYIEFFKRVIIESRNDERMISLISCLLKWLNPLSRSKIRCIRHASTVAATGVCIGIAEARKVTDKELNQFERQKKSEKTKGSSKVVKEIDQNISALQESQTELNKSLDTILSDILRIRYKDICDNIRGDSIQGLIQCCRCIPDVLLTNQSHMKFIGWALSDQCPDIRICALEYLDYALSSPMEHSILVKPTQSNAPTFLQYFMRSLLNCTRDVDGGIRLLAVRCVTVVSESLEDLDVEEVVSFLWIADDIQLIERLGQFIDQTIFSHPVCRGVDEDIGNDEYDTRDLCSIGEFVIEFGKEYMKRTHQLVKAFWKSAPSLRNIELILNMLTLQEVELGGRAAITDEVHMVLMYVLRGIIIQAKDDYNCAWNDTVKTSSALRKGTDVADIQDRWNRIATATFNRLPTLFTRNKASPEDLRITACIAFEISECADKLRSSLNIQAVCNCLADVFKLHAEPQLCEAVAAALATLESRLEPVNEIPSNTINIITDECHNKLQSVMNILLNISNDLVSDSAEFKIWLSRNMALAKAGNTFYDKWIDLVPSLCKMLDILYDDTPACVSIIEFMVVVYIQTWCTISEYHSCLEDLLVGPTQPNTTPASTPSSPIEDVLDPNRSNRKRRIDEEGLGNTAASIARIGTPDVRKRKRMGIDDAMATTTGTVNTLGGKLTALLDKALIVRQHIMDHTLRKMILKDTEHLELRVASTGVHIQTLTIDCLAEFYSRTSADDDMINSIKDLYHKFSQQALTATEDIAIADTLATLIQECVNIDQDTVSIIEGAHIVPDPHPISRACPFISSIGNLSWNVDQFNSFNSTVANTGQSKENENFIVSQKIICFTNLIVSWIVESAHQQLWRGRCGVLILSLAGRTCRPELECAAEDLMQRMASNVTPSTAPSNDLKSSLLWSSILKSMKHLSSTDLEKLPEFVTRVFKLTPVVNHIKSNKSEFLLFLTTLMSESTNCVNGNYIHMISSITTRLPKHIRYVFDNVEEKQLIEYALSLTQRRNLNDRPSTLRTIKNMIDRMCRTKLNVEVSPDGAATEKDQRVARDIPPKSPQRPQPSKHREVAEKMTDDDTIDSDHSSPKSSRPHTANLDENANSSSDKQLDSSESEVSTDNDDEAQSARTHPAVSQSFNPHSFQRSFGTAEDTPVLGDEDDLSGDDVSMSTGTFLDTQNVGFEDSSDDE
eukprot:GHVO01018149.1.p1 GENE.GHVO01018149.1~~GHVO01018149.1.p1  ORF type:complete len:1394 (-),score=238.15 GHVO01018149.1:124-4284(-)